VRDEVDDGQDRNRDAQEPRKSVLHRDVPFGERSNDLLLDGKSSKRRAARFSSLFDDSTSHFSVTMEAEWCT